MPAIIGILLTVGLYMLVAGSHNIETFEAPLTNDSRSILDREPIQPIESPHGLDEAKVSLGKSLFYDPRLSTDNSVSCASCHVLESGGSDGLSHSTGALGRKTTYNSLTVLNAALNSKLTWLGKYGSLYQQTEELIVNKNTLGSNWKQLEEKLSADQLLNEQFIATYKSGVSKTNIVDALVQYEKSLCLSNSRFDEFLKGKTNAISKEELEGYKLFKLYGCASCHQGVNVGGNMFMKFGIFDDYFKNDAPANLGRFQLTKNEADRYVFRVPSLRNAELTAPYFHDGSASSLDEAVAVMAKYQLGRELPAADQRKIVAFLKTLTGVPKHEK